MTIAERAFLFLGYLSAALIVVGVIYAIVVVIKEAIDWYRETKIMIKILNDSVVDLDKRVKRLEEGEEK